MEELCQKNIELYNELSKNTTKLYLMASENQMLELAKQTVTLQDQLNYFEDLLYSLQSKFVSAINNSEENILKNIKEKGSSVLKDAPVAKLNDSEFMKKAYQIDATALTYCTGNLVDSKDFFRDILKEDGWNIVYASDKLKNDKELLLLAIKNSFTSIQCFPEDMCDDEDIILLAASGPEQESMMEYASDRLKLEKEFAKKLLSKNGMTIDYFFKEIKSDKELVELAILNDPESYYFIDSSLKKDKKLALKALGLSKGEAATNLYNSFNERLKNDMEIVLMVIDKNPDVKISDENKEKVKLLFS